jgi:23S rRNA (guanosine2251-2'-O)-methyltransferase
MKQQKHNNRKKNTPYYLWGIHSVIAAINNKNRILMKIYVSRNNLPMLTKLEGYDGLNIEIKENSDIDKLFPNRKIHQGIVLETKPLVKVDYKESIKGQNIIVALDQIKDPQNIGSIIRTTKFFGGSVVITTKKNSPGESGALAKAASGILESIKLVEVSNLSNTLKDLSKKGYIIIGLDENGDISLKDLNFNKNQNKVLVLGSEGKGLRRLTKIKCDYLARIENSDISFSTLNVSTSAAIALYQLNN